jgi:deazaflavin-dependent oxidoreductase (nitroreductase family)
MRDWDKFNAGVIEAFRANGGIVEGRGPLLLLTTIGARSGLPRVAPLVYTRDRDDIVIIASKGAEPTNPDWYHNLVAHPEVTVELGSEQSRAKACVTEGDERGRLYDAMAAEMPFLADYERKTERTIPLVVVERLPSCVSGKSSPTTDAPVQVAPRT